LFFLPEYDNVLHLNVSKFTVWVITNQTTYTQRLNNLLSVDPFLL